jgi:nitroreductase/Pyruvate/2-oxoacid:ferredoxin oxidoreductase delta subunit
MAFLEINQKTCSKCGACAGVCPGGLIVFEKKEFPKAIPDIKKYCIRCGHCVAVCPKDSVIHRECPVEKCPPIQSSQKITFEQGVQLIKSRRSIRAYRDKPVSREIITQLIDTARYAPTGGNSQGVKWLVFDSKEKMRRFSEIGTEWMHFASRNNPATAAYMAKAVELQDTGREGFLRGAPAIVLACAEKNNPGAANKCTSALGYFDLAANSMGLGCMWAGFFMFAVNFPPMAKEIALPEELQIYGAMTIGYPEYQYKRIPVRKPAQITWK